MAASTASIDNNIENTSLSTYLHKDLNYYCRCRIGQHLCWRNIVTSVLVRLVTKKSY